MAQSIALTENQASPSRYVAMFGLLLCALIWSGNTLVARGVVGFLPPVSLAFWRWMLAVIVILPFTGAALWRYRLVLLQYRWRILILSALGISTFNTLLYSAAISTTAINISLINTSLPVAVFLWLVLLFKQMPGRATMLGTLLSFIGLLIILMHGEPGRLLSVEFNSGDVAMLLAVMAWGLYTVLLERWSLPVPGTVQLAALLIAALPVLVPGYLLELSIRGSTPISWEGVAAIAYTGILASLFAHLAWNHGIKVVGPVLASLSHYLIPVFTVLFGVLLLGEQLQWFHVAGGALTLLGLLIASRG